jgi:uncharacterized protein YacL
MDKGGETMWKKALTASVALLGALAGYRYAASGRAFWMPGQTADDGFLPLLPWLAAMAGALVLAACAAVGIESGGRLVRQVDRYVRELPISQMTAGLAGLVAGLFVSLLLYPSLAAASGSAGFVPFLVSVILGGLGMRFGFSRKDEVIAWLSGLKGRRPDEQARTAVRKEPPKILDTSVIIDGRIADICKTGFIQGTLVIPEFVLEELQRIADSSDLLKRNRGRRGLDILNKMQKEQDVDVVIYEGDFDDVQEVDSKLVRLARLLGGQVLTNDFNLNKVCELQGVPVLNINDLANAIKPVVLPGEEIAVQVIKDGKEYGQGVAYLDDGTMIVVEGGREHIGSKVDVLVTSVLQTSAGRMIFAKPKLLEKAQ